jgi:phage N-6-adenine-methyltransferase
MNQITSYNQQLPSTIEELSKFALVGREKLVSVRAEIRAIDKLGLAEKVRKQKLEEAQMISEAVLDAEVKIGTLTAEIPKATNQYKSATDSSVASKPTKQQAIKELGFTVKQVERFEQLAKHPEIVEKAKVEARENDDVISRSFVLDKIKQAKNKPFVANNTGNNEWYTPSELIESARLVMGSIDLDPATSKLANEIVKAETIYTIEDDGLIQEWFGNVWLNPPYSTDLISKFITKLIESDINQAIVLVNNATETNWFNELVCSASAIVFPKGRIKFYTPNKETGAPLQGQAIIYIGNHPARFIDEFKQYGWSAYL